MNLNQKIIAICLAHHCQAYLNNQGSVTMEIQLTHRNWQHVQIERVDIATIHEAARQLGY